MSKNSLPLLLLLFQFLPVFGINFFSDSNNSDPNDLNNWWTETNNTGGHPTDFTQAGDQFRIQTGHDYTTTAEWTVGNIVRVQGKFTASHDVTVGGNLNITSAGDGVKLMAGIVFTVGRNLALTGDVEFLGDAELRIGRSYTSTGSLTTFTPSTVTYLTSSTIGLVKTASYHHLTIDGTTNTRVTMIQDDITVNGDLHIEQGTLDCNGYQITGNSTGTFSIAATGALILGDETSTNNIVLPTNFTEANTTFDPSSSITFASDVPQVIPVDETYGELIISSGSSLTKTIAGDLVATDLTVSNVATLDLGAFTHNISDDLTVESTASLSMSTGIVNVTDNLAVNGILNLTTGTLDVDGNISGTGDLNITSTGNINVAEDFSNTGILTAATGSTVTYDGPSGANRVLKSATYDNLIINKDVTSSEAEMNGDITVNGNLTIASGDLATNQYAVTGNATGTLSIAAGEKLVLGLTSDNSPVEFPSNFVNFSIDPTSIVQYNSNTSHNISNVPTYGNLVLNSGTSVTKTATGDLTILNDFTINDPVIFDLGTNLLDIEKELEVNGVLTSSTGTIDSEGDITGTGDITFTGAGDVFIAESFDNTGVFTPSTSTVTYDGTPTGSFKETTYHNLIIDKVDGVNTNVSASFDVSNDLTIKNGDLRVSGSGVTVSVSGTTTIEENANLESLEEDAIFDLNTLHLDGGSIGGSGTSADYFASSLLVTGTTSTIGSADVEISGITTIDGDIDFVSGLGQITLVGDVTVNGTWVTTSNTNIIIQDDVINNGIIDATLGAYTFTGASKNFSGTSSSITFNQADFSGSYTNNIDTLIFTDSTYGVGSLTNGVDRVLVFEDEITINTLDVTASPNTVIYRSDKTTEYYLTDYHHLIVDLGDANRNLNVPGGTSNIIGDFTITSGDFRLDTLSIINVSGSTLIDAEGEIGSDSSVADLDRPDVNLQDLTVRDGGRIGGGFDRFTLDCTTLTMTGSTNEIRNAELTVAGVTNITGDVEIKSAAGTKTFQDDVFINGSWTHTANRGEIVMDKDLIVNGTFEADMANFTFTGPSKQLGGTITRMTLNDATFTGTYTNNIDTLFMSNDLKGAGSLTNAANMRLEISRNATITTLDATAVPNTVVYFGDGTEGNQDGKETDYYDLIINNRGDNDVTFSSSMSVANHLHVKQGTYELNTISSRLTGNADLTVDSGAKFEIATRNTFASPIPELTGTYTLDINSTMEFDGAASDIRTEEVGGNSITYGHLVCSGRNIKNLTGDINIDGNLTIESDTYLSQTSNNYTINLAGNWTSTTTNASFSLDAREGKVILDGATDQTITITGRAQEEFYDLSLKNNGNTVILNGNIVIDNALEFETDGYLNLSNSELLINDWDDGDIIGSSLTRFVIGSDNSCFTINGVDVGETAEFPLSFSSSPSGYCGLQVENNDASANEFKLTTSNYINEEGTSSVGTTIIEETVNITYFITSNSTDADLTFFWDTSNELTAFDRTSCKASHWDTEWKDFGILQNATNFSGSIYSITTNATEFSPFGIGSGSSSVLPIELLSFDLILVKDKVKLEWVTGSEMNNDYFVIERSNDLGDWLSINQIDGSGNSSSINEYHTFDPTPITGVTYYRLKQVDYDGTFTYSNVRSTEYYSPLNFSFYPNPVIGNFLFLNMNNENVKSVKLYNSLSQLVKEIVINENTDFIKIDVSDLQPQVYLLKVESDSSLEQKSIIVK